MPNLETVIELLKVERQKIDSAIAALAGEATKPHRGLPPKLSLVNAPDWVTGKKPAEPTRKKRMVSVAQRKKQAAAMRRFWKNKKKETKTSAATA